jgi:hypothetical protein
MHEINLRRFYGYGRSEVPYWFIRRLALALLAPATHCD